MPDISLCVNANCPIRMQCYRATAKPNTEHQTFAKFYYDKETKSCENFIEAKSKSQVRRLDKQTEGGE